VIREAVRMLSAKGLLSIAKGKGIFVRFCDAGTVADPLHLYLQMQVDRDCALDVVRARQIIEPSIAAEAALKRTDADLEKLDTDILELRDSREGFTKLASLDMAFHLDIARSSHNTLLPLLLDPIHRLMPDIKSSVYKTVDDARDSALVWHRKILENILKRDAEGARTAMIGHLKIAEEHTLRMLRAQRTGTARPHGRT
jgi:GntR family transcriptional repressor for pyruvate dehydrogenase complex